MSKSVFEMISEVMNNCGYKTLLYSWIITSIIISCVYILPMVIKHIIETKREEKEIRELEKELRELKDANR